MYAIPPGVPESLHLLRFAGDMVSLAILDIAACRRPLEIAVELDPIGWIDIDTLHLAAQPLPLRQ